ncbi:MAG: N-acetylglucosamine-6-phosphate deacetylase [Acidobacteriota bacterium]|nr:N-acetylglucosamine-6-phosphate deacetylase [Acidobacteriota bacterium]
MRLRGCIGTNNDAVDLLIERGQIADIVYAAGSPCDFGDANLRLSAGFVDLQVNGYGGMDFNDSATTTEQIAEITRRLWRTGVTKFCPTIITESAEHISKCLSNLVRATDGSPEFQRAFAGIHLEGPFISTEDGPRGAHPRQHACPPNWEQFQRWQEAANGRIVITTLSPEWPEACKFIERAAGAGVVVAIGHTAATPRQIADAVSAGAKMSTHLGNGSHAKIDRHVNYIWEQLANDDLWASFIVDGHHLPPSVVKCFVRSKGINRSILVTDAIAAAGCPPGKYKLGNVEVEVLESGRVCLPGTPYLAGSAVEMHDSIGKAVLYSGVTLDEALQMATANPAEVIGQTENFGRIKKGAAADLVLFDWDETAAKLNVVATIVNGEIVYHSSTGKEH